MTEFPQVRQATLHDFDDLVRMRDAVSVELLERGIHSALSSLSPHDLAEWIKDQILFVVEVDGAVVGSIAVRLHDPVGIWPPADLAGYIHDLMIVPQNRREGLGLHLLVWAERYVAGLGRGRVRLDCDVSNERLFRYYKEAGYRHVRTTDDGLALFEKNL
ncbi:MAG: GNAT family N-acetyltransferase [Actinomycetota bacterium]